MGVVQKKFVVSNIFNDKDHGVFYTEIEALKYISMQEPGNKYMVMPSYHVVDEADLKYRVSIVMPVWGQIEETKAAIKSVFEQDTNGWELFVVGDCCPYFQTLIDSGYFEPLVYNAMMNGNRLVVQNLPEHWGGYGYKQRNICRQISHGKYTMYLDNDDLLLPNHLSHRLAMIENNQEDYDLIGFETWRQDIMWHRDTDFVFGKIGHAEIVIKTEFLKTLPESDGRYGHDWTMVEHCILRQCKRTIVKGAPYTYRIMKLGQKF